MIRKRHFTRRQKEQIFRDAQGLCARCEGELGENWEADHVLAFALGGQTSLSNSQALCMPCNRQKGQRVEYNDKFKPRRFQYELINRVIDRMLNKEKVTVGLAAPGSGKTLTYYAIGTETLRLGLIDYMAVFVPRLALAKQGETGWMHQPADADGHIIRDAHGDMVPPLGQHLLFDARARMGKVRHVRNSGDLTPPRETGVGFYASNAALTTNPGHYLDWAQQKAGRFLLVIDEGQFAGAANDGDGTMTGRYLEQIAEHAAHVLILTGTPERADGKPLILCDYPVGKDGIRRLAWHARATYEDGIRERYLRRFESELVDGPVTWHDDAEGTSNESFISSKEFTHIKAALKKDKLWQKLVDRIADRLREKKSIYPGYKALISCMEQGEARRVQAYLRQVHPDLYVRISISDDGPAAEKALQEFKVSSLDDVLVTVRKAFIGYDVPDITVVGVLTHYRDPGHLMQLVGRGLRVSEGRPESEQRCVIIAPDDPGMKKFIKYLREEELRGLRDRTRESTEGPPEPRNIVIDDLTVTSIRVAGTEGDIDDGEFRRIIVLKEQLGLVDDITKIADLLRLDRESRDTPRADPIPQVASMGEQANFAAPMTDRAHIESIGKKVSQGVRDLLKDKGIYYDKANQDPYRDAVRSHTVQVNDLAAVLRPGGEIDCLSADKVDTVDDALLRLRAVSELRARYRDAVK